MDKLSIVENANMKDAVMPIEVGDTVKVWVKIVEGDRERLQAYEGVVIAISGKGVNRAFKVRKIAYGVGVERTFLLHSPRVDHVDILRRGKVRRAKLYYLRAKSGKKGRLVERVGAKIPKYSDLLVETGKAETLKDDEVVTAEEIAADQAAAEAAEAAAKEQAAENAQQ